MAKMRTKISVQEINIFKQNKDKYFQIFIIPYFVRILCKLINY